MTRRDVKDPALTPKKKTELSRMIDRQWLPTLGSSEAKCIRFLFSMITDWSKAKDRVKQEQFVNGTKSQAGTGLSLRTVIRALKSLTEKGAVMRLRTPRGHVYTINFGWTPGGKGEPEKAPQTPVETRDEMPVICQTGISRYASLADAHIRGIPIQEIPFNRPADASAPSRISKKLPPKRDAYVDPLDKRKLRALFAEISAEAFPDIVVSPWGQCQEAQACQFVNVDKAKRSSALEVYAWSVREWRLIIKTRFAWMVESPPPEFPSIGFMVKFRDQFFDAWNDRERLRLDREAIGDRRALRKLVHSGLTPEEAAAKVAKTNKEADLKDELAKLRGQLNRAYRVSEAAQLAVHRSLPPRARPVKANPVAPPVGGDW